MRKIFLILLLCLAISPVFAVDNKAKIYKDVIGLCKLYNKECKIVEIKEDGLGAYTSANGTIRVTTGLLDAMTDNEVRAVLYHEVGHVVFGHVVKLSEHIMICKHNGNCNLDYISSVRKHDELEADRFAVYIMLFTHRPESLTSALKKLTPPEEFNRASGTHPSTAERIRQIDRIMRR